MENSNIEFNGGLTAKQSIENVKSLATIWNEYFTALVYLELQQSGYRTVEHIKNMIKVNAEYADQMLAEYKERHGG